MTNPCPHARSAAEFITTRAVMGVEKYGHTLGDAALSPAALVRHAREEAADLLVYLTALEASMAAVKPAQPTAPEWFRAWLDMEQQKEAAGRKIEAETTKPEPTRPAVTREAVMRVVTEAKYTDCPANAGDCCTPDKCPCARTIDAIMALIGGAQ